MLFAEEEANQSNSRKPYTHFLPHSLHLYTLPHRPHCAALPPPRFPPPDAFAFSAPSFPSSVSPSWRHVPPRPCRPTGRHPRRQRASGPSGTQTATKGQYSRFLGLWDEGVATRKQVKLCQHLTEEAFRISLCTLAATKIPFQASSMHCATLPHHLPYFKPKRSVSNSMKEDPKACICRHCRQQTPLILTKRLSNFRRCSSEALTASSRLIRSSCTPKDVP